MTLDRKARLTPHFTLGEFVPTDCDFVPPWIQSELGDLCLELLEPIRNHMGTSIVIHSGWRPPDKNRGVGGVKTSDHMDGRAADFHVTGNSDHTWEERTQECFRWAVDAMSGRYGQLILEDHRESTGVPTKLWVHIASPSMKHPGTGHDPFAVLFSSAPGKYVPYRRPVAPDQG